MLPHPLPSENHQNALRIHNSVSALLVGLVCFLDSIVDRYVFIAILLFIFWIFFLLLLLNEDHSPFHVTLVSW